MQLTIAIALIAYLCAYVKAETCPPESLTRPCECFPELGLTLECRKITDATILDGISRRTGDITFEKLRIFNSSIDSIPPSVLVKKQLKNIEIIDSKLHSLFEGVDEPNNLMSLKLLHVEFGRNVPWNQLKFSENLTYFEARRTFIPELGDEFKNNVNKELAYLTLSQTHTRWISDGVLSKFKKLREISFIDCGLRGVNRSIFPQPAEELFVLNLDGNQIHELPSDLLKEMPKVEIVSMKGNRLPTFDEKIFKQMDHKLQLLNLEYNPIKCDCDLKWVASSTYTQKHGVVGKCQSGLEELRDKELETLKPEDFDSCQ